MAKEFDAIAWAKAAMRRASVKARLINKAVKDNKFEKPFIKKDGSIGTKKNVWYTCAHCECEFKSKEIERDHTIPVAMSANLNEFANLLVKTNTVKILCIPCHKTKTLQDLKDIAVYKRTKLKTCPTCNQKYTQE